VSGFVLEMPVELVAVLQVWRIFIKYLLPSVPVNMNAAIPLSSLYDYTV